jgi:hypothetical protein
MLRFQFDRISNGQAKVWTERSNVLRALKSQVIGEIPYIGGFQNIEAHLHG